MRCKNFTPPYTKRGHYRGPGANARGRVPPNAAAGRPSLRENCNAFRHPPAIGTMSASEGLGGYLHRLVKERTATPSHASLPVAAKRACDRLDGTLSPAGKQLHSLLRLGQGSRLHRTRRCSRRFGLSRSVQSTARAIPPRG